MHYNQNTIQPMDKINPLFTKPIPENLPVELRIALMRFQYLVTLHNPYLEPFIETATGVYNIGKELNDLLPIFIYYASDTWAAQIKVYLENKLNTCVLYSTGKDDVKYDLSFEHSILTFNNHKDIIPYSIRFKIAVHFYIKLITADGTETSHIIHS